MKLNLYLDLPQESLQISYFDYQNYLYIVEYNNLICNQKKCNKIKIDSNDKIELISIVGGG